MSAPNAYPRAAQHLFRLLAEIPNIFLIAAAT
jgi:hypothetical protein